MAVKMGKANIEIRILTHKIITKIDSLLVTTINHLKNMATNIDEKKERVQKSSISFVSKYPPMIA